MYAEAMRQALDLLYFEMLYSPVIKLLTVLALIQGTVIRGHCAYPGAVGRITSTAPFFFPPPAPQKQDGPLRGGPAAGGVVAALKLPSPKLRVQGHGLALCMTRVLVRAGYWAAGTSGEGGRRRSF